MGKRILVADDSVTIQRAFSMVFGGQDVTLISARSHDEALAAVRNQRPDLVIADAALGNGNGYDLCAAIRSDGAARGLPVYILASAHVPYDEARGHKVGASGVLLKPFESQALIDRVSSILDGGAAERAPARPAAARAASPTAPGADDEDSYGEFTIERSSPGAPLPTKPASPPPAPRPVASPPPAPGGLRPSLIPGARPGGMPAGRPPMIPPPAQPAVARSGVGARTMMGMPAAIVPPITPGPARQGIPGMPPPVARTPAPVPRTPPPAAPPTPAAPVPPAVSSAVANKLATLAAKGPEYEAIAKLSRDVIEQVVWEVVPELAEVIIREEVQKLRDRGKLV